MRPLVKPFAVWRELHNFRGLSTSRPLPAARTYLTKFAAPEPIAKSRPRLDTLRWYHREPTHAETATPGYWDDDGELMDDTRSVSTTSSGIKRKKGVPTYYAVKTGHAPGIYYNWNDAKAQVTGFKGANYHKFASLTEAEEFMKNGSRTMKPKPGKTKFYAVRHGRVPGVYTDWPTVKSMITGVKGPDQRAFPSEEQAWEYVRSGKGAPPSDMSTAVSIKGDFESDASTIDARQAWQVSDHPSKKQRRNDGSAFSALTNGDFEPGTGPLPADAVDGFDPRYTLDPTSGNIVYKTEEQLAARKLQPTGEFTGPIKIWTDGSSLGNGTAGAVAGVGVYFGTNDPRNLSEPLNGKSQTNQRAELTAISRALDITPIDRDVLIYTDSYYSIQCVTEWYKKWRMVAEKAKKSEWVNSAGKKVENQDLIEPIVNRIEERKLARAETNFQWLKGHVGDPGNTAADALAVNGARDAQQLLAIDDFEEWSRL